MEKFIKMNEICISDSPCLIKTIVGSCIALCIWDGRCRIGGMAHIMLPESNGDLNAPPGKYANTAVRHMVSTMISEGSAVENMLATCAGGASMFQSRQSNFVTVGIKNFRAVKKELTGFGIPVVTEAIGGISGRRVEMNCASGGITISMLLKPA